MDHETENAVAIAELTGELTAARAETKTMPAEYVAHLERMERRLEARLATHQRWVIGMFIAAVVIIGILVRWPA